ncbi:MAG: M20/M25/M40 family metallo-hydrolase, partial [Caulobacterales bacterium]
MERTEETMQFGLRLALAPLAACAAIALALWANLPPSPAATAGKTAFDLARAQATVADVARAPHPVGSAEHARVRDAVAANLRALGLAVEIQSGFGVRQGTRGDHAIAAAPVDNIIAVLPGRDRAAPAVAVMAHYDSVPYAPGAADDAAGVAAVLETARVMSASAPPARDVIFLVTDSEEMGLLGAQLFYKHHPLAARVGIVVNADTRGAKGRAIMFQTSPGNAALIDLWARNAVSPTGNSLTNAIYRLLPNDTDMSVSLAAGKAGINSAFIDGQFDYHAPSDAPANLDPGTLQHQGQFALAMTQALANARALPAQGADAVYFDVFSLAVVRYPPALGWALTAVAGVLLVLLHLRWKLGWRSLWGTLGVLALTVAAGGACHALGAVIWPDYTIGMRERLAEAPAAFWAWLALCFGAVLAAKPGRALWFGALVVLIALTAASQIWLPGGGWLFGWPLLAALLIAA